MPAFVIRFFDAIVSILSVVRLAERPFRCLWVFPNSRRSSSFARCSVAFRDALIPRPARFISKFSIDMADW
jgi:hypothetical protein